MRRLFLNAGNALIADPADVELRFIAAIRPVNRGGVLAVTVGRRHDFARAFQKHAAR